MKLNRYLFKQLLKGSAGLTLAFAGLVMSGQTMAQEGYATGDIHQHSTYTDGSYSIQHVMNKNNQFGLDWWANSEHGGGFTQDASVSGVDLGQVKYWDQYTPNPIIGLVSMSGGHRVMWRWQTLRDYSFAQIQIARQNFPDKVIFQSYEWNAPGHEHADLGLISGQFDANPNANAIAEFEYKFDASDADVAGGAAQGWTKSANPNNHTKTVEAVQWLEANYPFSSYAIPTHVERQNKYTINHFRDMNNAAPDVAFGFESMPGHQLNPQRGGYSSSAVGGGTYGGTGYFTAVVGGLWDAMLSEGRHYWFFASSDFHETAGDFYPGEYQKTYTWVQDKQDPASILAGLRSGNSFSVEGDLINDLQFKGICGGSTAEMGEMLEHGHELMISIKVKDPSSNNNNNENPALNHIDLIMGDVTNFIDPSDPEYNNPTVSTTSVIARFDAVGGITDGNGLTSIAWQTDPDGYITINYPVQGLFGKHYFRLRGTNLGLNVSGETDANGNPLLDPPGTNNRTKVYHDLWFYSNPIFTKHDANIPLNSWGIVLAGVFMALLFVFRKRF